MHLNSFKWLSWAVAFAFITLISTKRKICFFLFSGCVEIKKFTSLMRIKRKKCESCGITVKSVTQWIQNDTYRNATNFHLWCNKSASAKWSSHSKLLTEQLWSLKMMFLLKLFSFFSSMRLEIYFYDYWLKILRVCYHRPVFFYTELSSASVYRLNYWQAHAICSNTIWRPIASDSSRKMSSNWNQPKEIYRTKGK